MFHRILMTFIQFFFHPKFGHNFNLFSNHSYVLKRFFFIIFTRKIVNFFIQKFSSAIFYQRRISFNIEGVSYSLKVKFWCIYVCMYVCDLLTI